MIFGGKVYVCCGVSIAINSNGDNNKKREIAASSCSRKEGDVYKKYEKAKGKGRWKIEKKRGGARGVNGKQNSRSFFVSHIFWPPNYLPIKHILLVRGKSGVNSNIVVVG
jgi:hypothetical protein